MIEEITNLIKTNSLLQAGLGVSGFGLVSFWIRDVPLKLFTFLKRQSTVELTIQNYDSVFYDLLNWIKEKNQHKNFRSLKLNNGRYGQDEDAIASMGYGNHIIWYKGRMLLISYNKEKESISDKIKESITIRKLGRNKNIYEAIINELKQKKDDDLKVYTRKDNYWGNAMNYKKRNMNSIFIEQKKKDLILNNLQKFIQKEDWYIKSGIPYQYGILLYGKPGTGKTSLIKAIASYLDYNIYYLSSSKLYNIQSCFADLPEKSIMVIEDIDGNSVIQKRKVKNKNSAPTDTTLEQFKLFNISDILNSLDGLCNTHNRILICTTNHLKHLDNALIRPGRFDILINIGFVNKEILQSFLNYFFPKNTLNFNNIKIKQKLTVAELQNLVLLGKNENDIFKYSTI